MCAVDDGVVVVVVVVLCSEHFFCVVGLEGSHIVHPTIFYFGIKAMADFCFLHLASTVKNKKLS